MLSVDGGFVMNFFPEVFGMTATPRTVPAIHHKMAVYPDKGASGMVVAQLSQTKSTVHTYPSNVALSASDHFFEVLKKDISE